MKKHVTTENLKHSSDIKSVLWIYYDSKLLRVYSVLLHRPASVALINTHTHHEVRHEQYHINS